MFALSKTETMKKMVNEKGSLDTKLSRFLLSYRTTPQTTTGKTPCELLVNRKLKTRLDLVNPLSQNTTRTRVEDKQLAQKKKHDSQAPLREFQVNDPVFVKNFSYGPMWKHHSEVRPCFLCGATYLWWSVQTTR